MKRKSIGKLLCLASCLAAFAVLSVPVGHAEELTLAAQGKTDYQIVIPDSSPSLEIGKAMTKIAKLVQNAFKANGFEIEVVPEAKRVPDKPGIYLGDTAFARSNGVNVATFPDWRYAHKVVGRDIIVAGRDQPRVPLPPIHGWVGSEPLDRLGTLKAAADFLRQYAGVRFLLPCGETGIEFLPTSVIAVPTDLNVVKIPALQYFCGGPSDDSFYSVANNWFPLVDISFPTHTWPMAIPAKTYGETHPEYFALINGKRYPAGEQYCISNPDVQELIYKELLGRADKGYELVEVGQPDGYVPCQCEACKKLFGTGDDWDEKIWILDRNMAERLLKERPEKKMAIMAYGQTYHPPKSFKEFPSNTFIVLTHWDSASMEEWSACKVPGGYGVHAYTFYIGGYMPMQTPLALDKLAKHIFKNNFKGIYTDGFGYNYGLMGPSFYVYGRMFDDPANLQAKDLLEEFYEGAFRESATPMRRFFDTLYHAVQFFDDAKWSYQDVYGRQRNHSANDGDSMKLWTFIYSPDVLKDLETHLGQAERLATSEKVKRRLALVRLEFDRIRHIATVGHLWNAFRIDPDPAARERLLQAVDDWNTFLKIMYDDGKGGRLRAGMRGNVIPGWPEMNPFGGHSHHAVASAEDNNAHSPLNWNTAEMRKTALAATRRLAVKPADGAITIDAPAWSTSEAGTFSALPGDSTPVTCQTSVRMLYDKTQVYLRLESELPGTFKDFAPVVKDGQPAQAESLDIAIDPFGAREKFYHFIVGPQAQPRYQAAHGFIADTAHPLYGKDDPGWQGSWTYETRLEPEKNRWLALLTIPYKTLGVELPAVGAMWRANVIRLHVAASDRLERSAWSATAQNKGGHDQNAFGELVFDDASGSAGTAGKAEASPLRKAREELYRTTFEIPPEWKVLPNLLPASAWGPWRFHEDPADKGMKENWFSKDLGDTGWTPIKVPSFWAETDAGDIQGYGWYRVVFTVPADWKGKTVRLLFGAADEQAWVYVNGTLVGEHSTESEKLSALQLWDVPFAVEVKPELLTYGGANVLAVRVHNAVSNGGIWRPVLAHALDSK